MNCEITPMNGLASVKRLLCRAQPDVPERHEQTFICTGLRQTGMVSDEYS